LAEATAFDSVCFSPDGKWLASGYKIATSRQAYIFWHVPTWNPGLVVYGNVLGEAPIAFSPDGRMVALETAPAQVRLLNPASGEEFATLEDPHMHRPRWMAITPDGTRLIISSMSPPNIHVWDLRLLRDQLAEAGLDWNLPPFPTAASRDAPVPCEIAVELSPDLYELRGSSHFRRKEFDEARADFREALKRDSKHADASNSLAWLYATGPREMWHPAEALPLALQAVKAQPNNRNYQNTLGVVYYRLGRWDDAVGILQPLAQAKDRGQAAAWDLYFLAMSYQRLGKPSEASACYQKALHIQGTASLTSDAAAELEQFRAEAEFVLGSGPIH
jgi:tetratricopeptide (TPR) repeat protein